MPYVCVYQTSIPLQDISWILPSKSKVTFNKSDFPLLARIVSFATLLSFHSFFSLCTKIIFLCQQTTPPSSSIFFPSLLSFLYSFSKGVLYQVSLKTNLTIIFCCCLEPFWGIVFPLLGMVLVRKSPRPQYLSYKLYPKFGQVVTALFATDCFICTTVQNHQAYANI